MKTEISETERNEPRLVFKPKIEKIVETILYLVHKRPGLDQYQTVKLLYLADKEHFNSFGRPITFDTYFALDYGPVASHALDIIKFSRTKGKRVELPLNVAKLDKIFVLSGPRRPVNYDLFSKSDLRVLDEVVSKYGDKSFNDLYELTHSHFAYDVAWSARGNSKASLMHYEDMLEESETKAGVVENLEGVSTHMR